MILDGIDSSVLFLMDTIREHFAGHDEGVILEVRCEIIKRVSDAVDRMGVQGKKCDYKKRFHVEHYEASEAAKNHIVTSTRFPSGSRTTLS